MIKDLSLKSNNKNKIPCIIWTFYNFDIIRRTIEFLIQENKFEIYVIENNSPFTKNLIQPYLLKLLHENKISKYIYFHNNISNNAIELFFDNKIIKETSSEYILITDGDLIVQKIEGIENWLDEELKIIKSRQDVLSCGINLSLHNVPLNDDYRLTVPDTDGIIHEDCVEFDTGIHLLLIKKKTFEQYLEWRRKTNSIFIDQTLRYFIKSELGKKWVVTKNNHAYHLTWDLYQIPDHPYTIFKSNNEFNKIWKHKDYSFFTIYDKYKKKNKYPFKAIRTKVKYFYWFIKKLILHKNPIKFIDITN